MMSASGIALVVITASLLKTASCSRHSIPSSALTIYDDYENTTPSTNSDPKIVVTLQLPHLSDDTPNFNLGHGRKKRS
ncbi:unnamed protein product, partial [Larinioides sclopetarius]